MLASDEQEEAGVPFSFVCPITGEVMEDPVSTADGYCYERSAIVEWLKRSSLSPSTGLQLENQTLIPNHAMRTSIHEWLQGRSNLLIDFSRVEVSRVLGVRHGNDVCEGTLRVSESQRQVTLLRLHALCRIRAASRLMQVSRHPRLVELLGTSSCEQVLFVVNEFCPGGSLQERLKSTQLSLSHVRVLLLQVVSGMEALHSCGLVHGNLSLENILCWRLDQRDVASTSVKLADFGLTFEYSAAATHGSPPPPPPYRRMSPESIRGSVFTAASDVWTFGVIAWQICSEGLEPFAGSRDEQVKALVLSGARLPRPDKCPVDLWELVKSCWEEAVRRPTSSDLSLSLLLTDISKHEAPPPHRQEEAEEEEAEEGAASRQSRKDSHKSASMRRRRGNAKAANRPLADVAQAGGEKLTGWQQSETYVRAAVLLAALLASLVFSNCSNMIRDAGDWAGRLSKASYCEAILPLRNKERSPADKVKHIINALAKDSNNLPLVDCGFKQMLAIDPLPPLSQKHLQSREYEVLMAAMQRHMEKAQVQEVGCQLMRKIIGSNPSAKRKHGEERGVDITLDAIKMHLSSVTVSDHCLETIATLLMKNQGSKTRLVAGSGVDLVVKLMELHAVNAAVQSRSCHVLASLAMHVPVIERIRKIGGVAFILAAFRRFRKEQDVVANCSLTLANMATCCGTTSEILQGGGLESLLEGMRRFPENVLVFSWGCEGIGNMATDEHFESHFTRSRGVETLLDGIRRLLHVQEAQVSGCRALLNLAHEEKHRTLIFEHGGTDLILSSMQQHPSSAKVQMFGCWAIHKMIHRNETVRRHVEERGGREIIARVVQDLAHDSSLLALCIPAQQTLAQPQ